MNACMQYFIEFLKSTQIWMVEGDIFKFLEHIAEYLTCCACNL